MEEDVEVVRQDLFRMACDYGEQHPEVDWECHEVFFVFDRDEIGKMVVGGHRPVDHAKNEQIQALVDQCCCGQEGCTW